MPSAGLRLAKNCPLKKRPVVFISDEPENLSTKPEDLSRTGSLRSPPPESRLSPEPSFASYQQPIKVEPRFAPPAYAPFSPEYAPQTWHRSVYYPLAYPYYESHMYVPPVSPYSDSSLSPPHQMPVQPLALRPTVYSSVDQSSLSPNSSNNSPSPQQVEDLSEKRQRAGIRHHCPDCGKSYSTFSGLTKHRQFHCAVGTEPKKTSNCTYCHKVYNSLGALKMHIRTHTLPCKCTICGKAFSRPWLLQGHIRTHTGEKPFSCTYCNRAFADRSNLRAHLQTHSDVKKYSCPRCSKTFSRMSLLTKHSEGGCSGTSSGLDKPY